jgi:hypothetical protein
MIKCGAVRLTMVCYSSCLLVTVVISNKKDLEARVRVYTFSIACG